MTTPNPTDQPLHIIDDPNGVVIVRPEAELLSKQQLPYFVGISQATAGSQAISMNMIIIPPGGRAAPHVHKGYETAIYVLQGTANTLYGEGLKRSKVCKAGDFIFIAANVPHQPVNMSDTDPVIAIVARNDANEQESVVHYDPNDPAVKS
jgi:uncharacterized RmlC-like cupin family protein